MSIERYKWEGQYGERNPHRTVFSCDAESECVQTAGLESRDELPDDVARRTVRSLFHWGSKENKDYCIAHRYLAGAKIQ